MNVICIDDKNRPAEVSSSKWVKKDEKYTVIEVMKCNAQRGIYGYKLEEIDLSDCAPYLYFSAHRFRIPIAPKMKENIEELELVA